MAEPTSNHRLELPPEAEPARAFIEALVAKFEKRIAELEKKLERLTPRNSNLPPAVEHPHARPQRPKKQDKSPRKRGGQPGHPRQLRELIPAEQCDQVIPCIPQHCRRCYGDLQDTGLEPRRHQVWELPEIRPTVTEYRCSRLHCPGCGITTQGELPAGVPTGQCGARLAAFTGLLMGHFRQSKRRTALFLQSFLNVPCSASWTIKIQEEVNQGLAAPYEEARRQLETQTQLFVDETPTKEQSRKVWLWVAVAPTFAVFGIFLDRSRESLRRLIGDYSQIILNCDRAKMYLDGKRLQWCWAHLKRDFQRLVDSEDGQVKRLGHDLMRQYKGLFALWRRYRGGEIGWDEFRSQVAPIRKKVRDLLLRGEFSGNDRLFGMCRELNAHADWLWTFTETQGIEPTNNTAERALRPAVIYRKLSFGTQSAAGSRFLERMLTTTETCRLQGRCVYGYLIQVMQARYANHPAPSLLPQAQSAAA